MVERCREARLQRSARAAEFAARRGAAPTHRVTHGTSGESVSQRVMIHAARMMMASVIRAISPRMAVAHRRPWCNEFAIDLSAGLAIMTRRSVVIARA